MAQCVLELAWALFLHAFLSGLEFACLLKNLMGTRKDDLRSAS
jgi:hypothetical protein